MANQDGKSPEKKKDADATECTAFCPVCGSDLYIMRSECACKNKECNWRCQSCAADDDV